MNNETAYKGLLEAIQVATVEHGATIAFTPGSMGGFDVMMLGRIVHVYSSDIDEDVVTVTNFINRTLEEVDG